MLVPVFIVVLLLKVLCLCSADIRLKENIKPKIYDIKLYPDLEAGIFKGEVMIHFGVGESYSYVSLHGDPGISITHGGTRLTRKEGNTLVPVPVTNINVTDDIITFILGSPMFLGDYVLEINYKGKIRDDMTGFYRSYYYHNGKKTWLGATQFEPYYARRAFPCFDEPRFRAIFNLVIHPVVKSIGSYGVISNVKAAEQMKNNGDYNFMNSRTMPTYLLAWIIYEKSSFISTPPYTSNGIEHRLWTQADCLNQTDYSHSIASKLLNALAKFIGVPYSLNKMDQVAVPDFSAGAMENWGIVTYREAGLLYAKNISTSDNLMKITMVIAHEFTHQWFGNLVTLEWWSYTWLNEAFARYFQYYILEEVYSDWRIDDQFVIMALQPSMEYDSKPHHAITSDINNSTDINDKFDMITYSKGASIVRMMEHILTHENFKTGLSRYINSVSSTKQVAEPSDLFNILMTVAPTNLPTRFDTIIKSWIDQPGYPVVTVTRQNDNTLKLSQKRGLYNEDNSSTIWHIPLTYTTKKEANFSNVVIRDWFTTNEKTLTVKLNSDDWIIFNIQQKGFYRVMYDDSIWNAIIQQLTSDHSKIGSLNRAQLIDDASFFAKAGKIDLGSFLTLSRYLMKELDYAPWYPAIYGLQRLLDQFYAAKHIYSPLKDYIQQLVNPIARNVGFIEKNGDTMPEKLKRMRILSFAARLDHPAVVTVADQIVKDVAKNFSTSYSPDVQRALLCTGLRRSNDKNVWQSIYTLYQRTPYATQQLLYLSALTCTQNSDLLKILVKDTLATESKIRRQDSDNLFKEIGSTPQGAKFLLDYITNNFNDFVKFNFGKTKIIGDVISALSGKIYDTADINIITKFNADKIKSLDERIYHKIDSIVSSIKKRLEFADKNKVTVLNWLTTFSTTTSTAGPPVTTASAPTDHSQLPPKSSGVKTIYSSVLVVLLIIYNFFC